MRKGSFVISLDFELHWGVSDHRTIESYYENLVHTPDVVRKLLGLFKEKKIHATWATVGMLFCRNKKELTCFVKEEDRPAYLNQRLSNYEKASRAGEDESDDPFHYAPTLISEIMHTPGQELATHTFSHYYCLEPGQTEDQFLKDLQAAVSITEREGVKPVSIVFPRNQYSEKYLQQCHLAGIKTYRGNPASWIYRPEAKSKESRVKRFFRLADAYLPISGHRGVKPEKSNGLVNIPGSCFLRPFNKKLSWLEPIRLWRIKREMTAAARKGMIYHLWWHPHNFGKNREENFRTLQSILEHFERLSSLYGMQSMNMKEIYEACS